MKQHRRWVLLPLMAAATLLIFMAGIAAVDAQTKTGAAKEEMKLSAEVMMLNNDAKLPRADEVITSQLTEAFDVREDKVRSLRDRKMDYGEIAAVLAFADKMDGGITDPNINRVTDLRLKRTDWGQIARNLKLQVGDVADKVSDIESDIHKEMKQTLAQGPIGGRGAGGMDDISGGATGGSGESRY